MTKRKNDGKEEGRRGRMKDVNSVVVDVGMKKKEGRKRRMKNAYTNLRSAVS